MKKYLSIIIVLFLIGCGNLPSVCDNMVEPSLLCDISQKHGVRLEDVGNALIIANALAIGQGLYTSGQAKSVLSELKAVLNGPVSYVLFKSKVFESVNAYPGLLEVSTIYFSELGQLDKVIYPKDRELLISWIDKQISLL